MVIAVLNHPGLFFLKANPPWYTLFAGRPRLNLDGVRQLGAGLGTATGALRKAYAWRLRAARRWMQAGWPPYCET
jgi:hypothetical protein